MPGPDGVNPLLLMQDADRRLFAWFAGRLDARQALRRAFGLTADINLRIIATAVNNKER